MKKTIIKIITISLLVLSGGILKAAVSNSQLTIQSAFFTVHGINPLRDPYPGTVIVNNWISKEGDCHLILPEGLPGFDAGFGHIESQAFRAYTSPVNGAVPIYMFEGGRTSSWDYLYTPSPNVDPYWHPVNVYPTPFYAYSYQAAGTVPVYCYTNSNGRNHYFSIRNETDPYWHRQYIAFYAYPLN